MADNKDDMNVVSPKTRLEQIIKKCISERTMNGAEAHAFYVGIRMLDEYGYDKEKFGTLTGTTVENLMREV